MPCIIERINNSKAVYLVLTPTHGNLGDHAIAQAEIKLLAANGIKVIEIPEIELRRRMYSGLLKYMNGRTILLHGGGYLGTLWFRDEELLRAVIASNPKSKIIIMPNTVVYEDSDWGNAEKQNSVKIYNAHNDLTVCTREKTSYFLAKNLYKKVELIPDMVFSMNYSKTHNNKRSGCILCLRSDKEKTMSYEVEEAVNNTVKELFGQNISHRDMVVNYDISSDQRDSELNKQYIAFQNAELVITDRLHGMIFSAITGTPCIVFNSKSPKVNGCYEWIKTLPYIRFCDDVNDLKKIWTEMPKGSQIYDNSNLEDYYDRLKTVVLNIRKK